VQALELDAFLQNVSIQVIPTLLAITLHEVAHGWMARYFGDRTAEMLGRLSLNPLRHVDPIGTVVVLLLAFGGPMFGWAKPVPVATGALRNPRRAQVCVALAGPAANLLMAVGWGGVFAAIARVNGNETLDYWIAYMARAGMVVNVVLAVFNLLPIPPLDGGRVLAGLLPPNWSARLDKIEPFGLFIVAGLALLPMFQPMLRMLLNPAFHAVGHFIGALIGSAA
jgi:Zn-dependent protease